MTDTPHLPAEDRPDYERALDEALRDPAILDALRQPGPHLNAEQLHTKALLAAEEIAASAAVQHRHYAALRDGLRQPDGPDGPDGPPQHGHAHAPHGGLSGRLRSAKGAGVFPVLTALTPVLAWAAAAVLLLLGYLLRSVSPEFTLGQALVTAGWVLLAVGAVALLVGIVGLLLTALRDGAASPDGQDPQLREDLAQARLAWLRALREEALRPYLLANLASEPALSTRPNGHPRPPEHLSPGYTSPGFSSPAPTVPTTAPDFTSPGYTSPDFTGPDEV
ncbi:hypothetical protein CFP65_3902 [Kitasatospora sp. MMS16-BH015]|uniref:hypothetical protein n=1 Tax=Kitasatospora sp. MMS16-BH015 TaxID=2018025 RepID=UPI000CA37921|nr:hypothetical protein [Kitasatospora sp. MMS16-BH015]AUG78675.1 hypothetical protein CFP65_3902 [Kitasatospora sp. MMS16-BH015]